MNQLFCNPRHTLPMPAKQSPSQTAYEKILHRLQNHEDPKLIKLELHRLLETEENFDGCIDFMYGLVLQQMGDLLGSVDYLKKSLAIRDKLKLTDESYLMKAALTRKILSTTLSRLDVESSDVYKECVDEAIALTGEDSKETQRAKMEMQRISRSA
jgi:hypothetical protein